MIEALALGLGGQLLAGGIGEYFAQQDKAEQNRLLRLSMDEFGRVQLPQLEKLIAEQVGPSELGNIRTDPAYKNAQLGALDGLLNLAKNNGMSLMDKANLNEIQSRTARTESAGRQRIEENMANRGISGGGAELAMLMNNNQAQAQRGSEEGLQIAAQNKQRALDAMLKSGQLAGNMRSQEYGEKSDAARANDAIARYNADVRYNAKQYNAGLAQQNFDNQMRKTSGKAGQSGAAAANAGNNADHTRHLWAGVGAASARAGDMAARYGANYDELADENTPAGRKARGL